MLCLCIVKQLAVLVWLNSSVNQFACFWDYSTRHRRTEVPCGIKRSVWPGRVPFSPHRHIHTHTQMLWVDALGTALMVRYYQIKAVLKASSHKEYLPYALFWNLLSLIRQNGLQGAEWLSQVTKETHWGLSAGTIDATCEGNLQGSMVVLISSQTLAHMVYYEGLNAYAASHTGACVYLYSCTSLGVNCDF